MAIDITALYCCLDDFCKLFADWEAHRLLPSEQTRQRPGKLSRAEMLLIVVLFHLSPFKHFKAFYHYGIGQQYRAYFGDLPHYDRFISLMPRLFVPLTVLLHSLSGEPSGIDFAASTKLAVCHNRRIHRHRVFKGLAARGKTSMGWFYGPGIRSIEARSSRPSRCAADRRWAPAAGPAQSRNPPGTGPDRRGSDPTRHRRAGP